MESYTNLSAAKWCFSSRKLPKISHSVINAVFAPLPGQTFWSIFFFPLLYCFYPLPRLRHLLLHPWKPRCTVGGFPNHWKRHSLQACLLQSNRIRVNFTYSHDISTGRALKCSAVWNRRVQVGESQQQQQKKKTRQALFRMFCQLWSFCSLQQKVSFHPITPWLFGLG